MRTGTFSLGAAGGRSRHFCSERCRRAYERELRTWAEKPDRRRRSDPCAVATRAFAGGARFEGESQVAQIMRRGTGAKGALS
jgi:hypothetical protein